MRKKYGILIVIIVLILVSITLIFLKQNNYIDIESNYIKTLNKIDIYTYGEIIGSIEDNNIIKISYKDDTIYLDGTNYYIKNKNIENSSSASNSIDTKDYVIDLGITITVDNLKLYSNNSLVLEIKDDFTFSVIRMDDEYYYINYLDNYYGIKKEDAYVKENNYSNLDIKSIYIPDISQSCNKLSCVRENVITSIISNLTSDNYYFITKEEYDYYKLGYINLKEGAILLETTNNNTNSSIVINNPNINISESGNYDYTINRYSTYDDIKNILSNKEVTTYNQEAATQIPVLNYHFFYDSKTEYCGLTICLDVTNFEEQLKYLKENNFKTLTIDEFISWMNKEIDLPKNSVLLTIDDGAMGTSKINGNKLIPLLEKYQVNATLFLITGWWKKENYQSDYLNIESHTNLMHEEGVCSSKARGAKMLCLSYEEKLADLKKSIEKLGSNKAFCFPFYVYDEESIKAVKEAGFQVAFIGENKKATQDTDKYKIPRYIIYNNTSLNSFKIMVG